MMKVIELNCEVKRTGYGVSATFSGGIGNRVAEITTKEEIETIQKCIKEITGIVGEAIARKVNNIQEEEMELSPELEALLEEAKVKFEELKTPGEKMDYALNLIDRALKTEIK